MKIIADLHIHTLASSHAYSSVQEIAQAAAPFLRAVAITDHAPAAPDAPHIWHFSCMKSCLPRKIQGVSVLSGAELNLSPGGGVDLNDVILQSLDFVICSMHQSIYAPSQNSKAVTADWLAACEHPYIDCLGHIGQDDYPADFDAIVQKCVQTDTLIEVNNASLRKGRESRATFEHWLALCVKYGCRIAVNTDAHAAHHVGRVEPALAMLDALHFPEELIVNADWDRLQQYVKARRKKTIQ